MMAEIYLQSDRRARTLTPEIRTIADVHLIRSCARRQSKIESCRASTQRGGCSRECDLRHWSQTKRNSQLDQNGSSQDRGALDACVAGSRWGALFRTTIPRGAFDGTATASDVLTRTAHIRTRRACLPWRSTGYWGCCRLGRECSSGFRHYMADMGGGRGVLGAGGGDPHVRSHALIAKGSGLG